MFFGFSFFAQSYSDPCVRIELTILSGFSLLFKNQNNKTQTKSKFRNNQSIQIFLEFKITKKTIEPISNQPKNQNIQIEYEPKSNGHA